MSSEYNLVYSQEAADFLLSLKRARLAYLLYDLRCLASDPFIRCDYSLDDEHGRRIEHLMVADFVIAFWVDHAASEIRILDLTDIA